MQIPNNIRITNAGGKTTAFLSPKADGLKDCCPDIRLNGESTLEFYLPANSEKINELTPECEIHAGGRVYILRKDDAIDTARDDNNKLWTKVMAIEKWYELDSSYVEPSISNDPTAKPPADLAVIIVGGGSNLTGGRYAVGTAAHALYAVLQGSGWSMGIVDVDGVHDLEAEKVSRLELIKMVQDIWGGYLVFDSVNKVIHLRDANKWQPYNGFQIRYKKNLKHITRTQSNRIVTKLYPFGHDDLDIANVNGGIKYITNFSYTSREYVGIYKNQDIYNQSELLEKAQAELELICKPRYLYKVKIVDVRVLPEYSHEDFKLGDMADVIDPDIAPDSPRPRIIRHKYNLFQPWKCELDIGDPEERLIEKLKASFGTSGFVDGKFKGNGDFSGHSIEDLTITADKIKTGSIEIGHLAEGFIQGLDLLENPVFSSYAKDVNNHATLIQQNGEQISLHATKIDGINTDISNLSVRADEIASVVASDREYVDNEIIRINDEFATVNTTITNQYSTLTQRADSIETNVGNLTTTVTTNYDNLTGEISSLSTIVAENHSSITQRADRIESNVSSISTDVSSLDSRVSSHSSQITQLSNSISSKVSYTDYNGNTIASMINQSATTVSINASKIDLTGITTIYSNDGNSYTTMGGSYSDFKIVDNGYTIFEVRNELAGAISLKSYGSEFLATRGSSTSPLGTWDFSGADVKNLNVIAKFA